MCKLKEMLVLIMQYLFVCNNSCFLETNKFMDEVEDMSCKNKSEKLGAVMKTW